MDVRLFSILNDDVCPSSTVSADLGCIDGNMVLPGVSRNHFEAIHTRFSASTWADSSPKWIQSVEYDVGASVQDPIRTPIIISYSEKDPMNVQCQRKHIIGAPVQVSFENTFDSTSKLVVNVHRTRHETVQPPETKTRYTTVRIQNSRTFKRISSSFKNVSFIFKLCIEWKANCLRDAYAAVPQYLLTVSLNLASDEMTNRVLESLTLGKERSSAFVKDADKTKWLVSNFKSKISDLCMSSACELYTPPVVIADRVVKKRGKKRSLEDVSYIEPPQESELIAEEGQCNDDGLEYTECYDDNDDNENDEFM